MGIFSPKAGLPTSTDLAAAHPQTNASADPEKASADSQIEDPRNGAGHHGVDPAIEARLIRKLDWRLPPLVAALCIAPKPSVL